MIFLRKILDNKRIIIKRIIFITSKSKKVQFQVVMAISQGCKWNIRAKGLIGSSWKVNSFYAPSERRIFHKNCAENFTEVNSILWKKNTGLREKILHSRRHNWKWSVLVHEILLGGHFTLVATYHGILVLGIVLTIPKSLSYYTILWACAVTSKCLADCFTKREIYMKKLSTSYSLQDWFHRTMTTYVISLHRSRSATQVHIRLYESRVHTYTWVTFESTQNCNSKIIWNCNFWQWQ